MNHAHRILPEIKQWIEKWKNTSCPDDSLVDKSLTRCHPGTLFSRTALFQSADFYCTIVQCGFSDNGIFLHTHKKRILNICKLT